MSIRLEEYKDRVNFKGRSKREYVKTKVTESIMSLIEDSQYGFTIDVYDKSNKTYSSHDVAILSTKITLLPHSTKSFNFRRIRILNIAFRFSA